MDGNARSPRVVAGLGAAAAASLLAAGCGGGSLLGGPSRDDYAQLIEIHETVPACQATTDDDDACRRLVDVEVTDTRSAGGNWTRVLGTATVAQDLYEEVYLDDAAAACGTDLVAVHDAANTLLGPDLLLLRTTVSAGTLVELDYELVVEPAADRADADPGEVSDGGWTVTASGGGFTAGDLEHRDMGFPGAFYGGVDGAIVLGSPAFGELCEASR